MKTLRLDFLLAKKLIESKEEPLDETKLMEDIWKELSKAIDKGVMLDVPLRRDLDNRIPGVVDTLKEWIGRGIVEYKEEANGSIAFTVIHPRFLRETISFYKSSASS